MTKSTIADSKYSGSVLKLSFLLSPPPQPVGDSIFCFAKIVRMIVGEFGQHMSYCHRVSCELIVNKRHLVSGEINLCTTGHGKATMLFFSV